MNASPPTFRRAEELLKHTTSRCPVCHASCPAEVWRVGNRPAQVFLKRTCPTHGEASVCIASDARFYWLAKGNPKNAGRCCSPPSSSPFAPAPIAGSSCGGSTSQFSPYSAHDNHGAACCAADDSIAGTLGRNAQGKGDAPFESLSTCLALIEIVHSCNLSCPTCYADSPVGTGTRVDAVPRADLERRIQGVIDRKGPIEILQFSGGEPTLHPEFFELIEWAKANPGIDYLLLNTNGVRLASEPEFAARLGAMFPRGGLQLYLQFDGVQAEGQRWLRGADLRSTRERAIERCAQANLPITLAMTVTPDNLPHLWSAIEFGLARPHIHGIAFQPMFASGRRPDEFQVSGFKLSGERLRANAPPLNTENPNQHTRLNTADILLAAVGQSAGRLRFEDFTPLPCGDPNCATIGYLIRADGRTHSISEFVDFSRLQGFLQDKVHYTVADLARCGCESEPLGVLLKQMELKASMTFRLMVKPFMDAWTWDQDRIDRCCTHVIRPDGKLDSFCRYYSGFADASAAP